MFYEKSPEESLRLGDVLEGYILSSSNLKKPYDTDYSIDIKTPDFCVILTPCCSIKEGTILLSPLERVFGKFFNTPHFAKDLTNINREMKPEEKYSPDEWKKKKEYIIKEGMQYSMQYSNYNLFIYDESPLFKKYKLKGHEIRYYKIDFRKTYRLKCPMIKTEEEMQERDMELLKSKKLQLSKKTRKELRDKFTFFFHRSPDDDEDL